MTLYDALNKIKKFVYQPKPGETLVDIVINSVALMRSLELREKLGDKDIEHVEEIIRKIRMEQTQKKC